MLNYCKSSRSGRTKMEAKKRRINKKVTLISLLLCAIAIAVVITTATVAVINVAGIGIANAQQPPPIPCFIEGIVKINNEPAPIGTVVTAKIEGDVKDTNILEVSGGRYTLTVEEPENGRVIRIYVNGLFTGQYVEWVSGRTYEIDLELEEFIDIAHPDPAVDAEATVPTPAPRLEAVVAVDAAAVPFPGIPGIPPMPASFYGNVTINEKQADAGTVVRAYIRGIERGNITVKEEGVYADGLTTFLDVRGKAEEVGEQINFTVEGLKANEVAIFVPGGINKLDLTVGIQEPEPEKEEEMWFLAPNHIVWILVMIIVVVVLAAIGSVYLKRRKVG